MPVVTCAALALALANPASSGTFTLGEDCKPGLRYGVVAPGITVAAQFEKTVVVEAGTHLIHGLEVVNGGNLVWRGGRIQSPAGTPDRGSEGPRFYGVRLVNARDVTLEGIHLSNSRKAVVVTRSAGVTLTKSRCVGLMEDCMIVSDSRTVRFTNNVIGPLSRYRPLCDVRGKITEGVRRAVCEKESGTWTDGWHSDVLQLRNGVIDVVASGNRINTTGQGLTQMGNSRDRPLANVRFENNVIASGRHGLTLGDCNDCRITGNRLTTAVPGWRSVIRPGQALACGNIVPDGGPGEGKCPG